MSNDKTALQWLYLPLWWIFALISKQALLKMWFYYLCHNAGCAWLMLILSQFCGCQQKSMAVTDYLTPLNKQLKKNLLHRNQREACRGNPSCHKVQVVKGSQTWVIQQQSPTHSFLCNLFFFLPFNNLHCGVSVVITMGLVLLSLLGCFVAPWPCSPLLL